MMYLKAKIPGGKWWAVHWPRRMSGKRRAGPDNFLYIYIYICIKRVNKEKPYSCRGGMMYLKVKIHFKLEERSMRKLAIQPKL